MRVCDFIIFEIPILTVWSATYMISTVKIGISNIRKEIKLSCKTTYYRQYGINKSGHIMLKPFFAHAPRAFVWLLDLYGGSLGSYPAIPLENKFLKNITDLGRGILKKRQQFFFDFDFV